MAKKTKRKKSIIPSRFTIYFVLILGVIVGSITYLGVSEFTPVNTDHLVFQAPQNVYLKAIKTPNEGYNFVSQSIKGGKAVPFGGLRAPEIIVQENSLVALHIINEDNTIPNLTASHNINIDEFNVHSKDLGHFGTQTISFVADKKGTFAYYCSLHPEMKGNLIVE